MEVDSVVEEFDFVLVPRAVLVVVLALGQALQGSKNRCHHVESVERTQDNNQHNLCLINMATGESTRSQHAPQVKSLHNKYIYGHNHTLGNTKKFQNSPCIIYK